MLGLKGERGIAVIVFLYVYLAIPVDFKLLEVRNWLFKYPLHSVGYNEYMLNEWVKACMHGHKDASRNKLS